MTTLKTAVVPVKVLKSGNHKIRIAIGHKQETRYLATRFEIESLSNFKNGQVVNTPDASYVNTKLRTILNVYQEALDKINTDSYTCKQIAEYLAHTRHGVSSFSAASDLYIKNTEEEGRHSTAELYRRTCKYFVEYTQTKISFFLHIGCFFVENI